MGKKVLTFVSKTVPRDGYIFEGTRKNLLMLTLFGSRGSRSRHQAEVASVHVLKWQLAK